MHIHIHVNTHIHKHHARTYFICISHTHTRHVSSDIHSHTTWNHLGRKSQWGTVWIGLVWAHLWVIVFIEFTDAGRPSLVWSASEPWAVWEWKNSQAWADKESCMLHFLCNWMWWVLATVTSPWQWDCNLELWSETNPVLPVRCFLWGILSQQLWDKDLAYSCLHTTPRWRFRILSPAGCSSVLLIPKAECMTMFLFYFSRKQTHQPHLTIQCIPPSPFQAGELLSGSDSPRGTTWGSLISFSFT